MSGDPMFAATTSMTVWLEISGTTYDLTGVEVTFLSQGISVAMAHLAVGYQASLNGGQGAAAIRYLVGTPAVIYANFAADVIDPDSGAVLLKAGQQTLFDGLYNDAGPGNLAKGSFTLWISLVSKLAQLNTGSLQYAVLLPNSFIDSTVPPGAGGNGTSLGLFLPGTVEQDFFGALKKVLNDIATRGAATVTSNSLLEFIAVFGDTVNTQAAIVLNKIAGSLSGSVTENEIIALAIIDYLNGLFTSNLRYQSFLQRIIELGQEFKFRIMEHPLGLAVVPYSPFFTTPGITVTPSTIATMIWTNQAPNNSLGVVFTAGGGTFDDNGVQDHYLFGAFKRKAQASPLGIVTSLVCPSWMCGATTVEGDPTTEITIPPIVARDAIGDAYAEETAYEFAYIGRTMQMTCPLRMDIGLLAALQVNYPGLPGVDLGTAIYGSVQAVQLIIDASAQQAKTVIQLGYVRSQFQQQQEFSSYTHPFWNNQYLGTRLDEVPLGTE